VRRKDGNVVTRRRSKEAVKGVYPTIWGKDSNRFIEWLIVIPPPTDPVTTQSKGGIIAFPPLGSSSPRGST
jgi:hypothetical protein